jgi:hypothetical protein
MRSCARFIRRPESLTNPAPLNRIMLGRLKVWRFYFSLIVL